MSSTKETTNYKLPIFEAADQPTWLGDFNGAMEKIDSAIASAGANASTALSAANNAVNRVGNVETNVSAIETTANNALSLSQTNEKDIGMLDGEVAELKTADTQTQARVKAMEDTVNPLVTSKMLGTSGRHSLPSYNGLTFSELGWQWVNGTLNFTGEETVSGTIPSDTLCVFPAGLFTWDTTGLSGNTPFVAVGSVGDSAKRFKANLQYNKTTGITSLVASLGGSWSGISGNLWIDLTAICGCDLSKVS